MCKYIQYIHTPFSTTFSHQEQLFLSNNNKKKKCHDLLFAPESKVLYACCTARNRSGAWLVRGEKGDCRVGCLCSSLPPQVTPSWEEIGSLGNARVFWQKPYFVVNSSSGNPMENRVSKSLRTLKVHIYQDLFLWGLCNCKYIFEHRQAVVTKKIWWTKVCVKEILKNNIKYNKIHEPYTASTFRCLWFSPLLEVFLRTTEKIYDHLQDPNHHANQPC